MKQTFSEFLAKKRNWPYFILALLSLCIISLCLLFFWPDKKDGPAGTGNNAPSPSEFSEEEETEPPIALALRNRASLLEAFLPEETPEMLESVSASDFENRIVVTADGYLNIRSAGSTEAPVIGKIYRGSAANIVEQGEGFTKIRSGSLEGWVSNDYILFGAEAEVFALEQGAWTATVLADRLNVREKPDNTSTILATVEKDQVFMVEEQGEWVKIFYTSSISGYLSAEYVKVEMSLGYAISLDEEASLLALYEEKESERQASLEAEDASKKEETSTKATQSSSVKKTTAAAAATTAAATKPTSGNSEVSTDDLHLLAAICQVEAGYSYDDCLPVAILIMNRVRSSKYPNTVHDVIYQKNQFPPASSGRLDKILLMGPCKGALDAAADALAGDASIDGEAFDYVHFCSSSLAKYDTYSKYKVIGGNCFYQK